MELIRPNIASQGRHQGAAQIVLVLGLGERNKDYASEDSVITQDEVVAKVTVCIRSSEPPREFIMAEVEQKRPWTLN